MNVQGARVERDVFSSKASEIVRALALAGVATVWLFRQGEGIEVRLDPSLSWAATLFVTAIAFDLLQYTYASFAWAWLGRRKEKDIERKRRSGTFTASDETFGVPPKLNWPTNSFFVLKLFSALAGYVLLLTFLFKHLN